jgi:hypothetical protein
MKHLLSVGLFCLGTACLGTIDDPADPRPAPPAPETATPPSAPVAVTPPALVSPQPAPTSGDPARVDPPRPDAGRPIRADGGSPSVSPDAGATPDVLPAAPDGPVSIVCTSNKRWNGNEGPSMRPGQSCQGCHGFAIAGTVFPTLHEPNSCNGASGTGGQLSVVITDARGATITLAVNSVGNFYSRSQIARPFKAKVVTADGRERAMALPQMSGACNSCHTPTGGGTPIMAPGRIMAP